MADKTEIAWCDSTFNPWKICTPVGPGCKNCYAAELSRRYGWGEYAQGVPRQRTSADNWKAPVAWNARPFYQCLDCGARFASPRRKEGFVTCPGCSKHGGRFVSDEDDASRVKQVRRRVFCASLADVFDNEVDPAWRVDLFRLIADTPNLTWLLLTKRIGNVQRMLEQAGYGYQEGHFGNRLLPLPKNIWLGATVVNQEEADRDIPKLLAIPARVRFLSIEPMLGPINLDGINGDGVAFSALRPGVLVPGYVDWVIAGGESGHHARPMHPAWARSLRDQCQVAGVPFLFKQWGEWAPHRARPGGDEGGDLRRGHVRYLQGDGREPDGHFRKGDAAVARVGKKAAGRRLDGREWNEVPA